MGNEPSHRSRNVVIILIVLMFGGAVLLTWLIHLTSADLVHMLDSTTADRVNHALQVLKDRGDPSGVAKAFKLMDSSDADTSMNAAIYLGSMKKPEAVPYLLKALPNAEPAYRDDIIRELTNLTSEPFGGDVAAWHRWWISQTTLPSTRT
jgi:hypothetical protein